MGCGLSHAQADLAHFLIDLGRAGVRLAIVPGDPTKVRHQPATLPDDIAARLPMFKTHLLVLLRLGYGPTDRRAEAAFAARLSVARGRGMAVEPGHPAWSLAIGEGMLAEIGGGI